MHCPVSSNSYTVLLPEPAGPDLVPPQVPEVVVGRAGPISYSRSWRASDKIGLKLEAVIQSGHPMICHQELCGTWAEAISNGRGKL